MKLQIWACMGAKHKRIAFDDSGPDDLGRRRFTLTWVDENGPWRPELGKDGQPVGFRRGQCFHADPTSYLAEGFQEE